MIAEEQGEQENTPPLAHLHDVIAHAIEDMVVEAITGDCLATYGLDGNISGTGRFVADGLVKLAHKVHAWFNERNIADDAWDCSTQIGRNVELSQVMVTCNLFKGAMTHRFQLTIDLVDGLQP